MISEAFALEKLEHCRCQCLRNTVNLINKKIMVEPDYQAWREYAYKENMHPAILSYLELRNNCFYRMETTIDGKQFATPRGWEDLSRMMEVCEQLGKDITEALVIQYIQHERIAKDRKSVV